MEQQIVRQAGHGDDAVLDIRAQRQLKHSFRVRDIRDEDPRSIKDVRARLPRRGIRGQDTHERADLARDAGLVADARGFALVQGDVAERVEEGGFADVGHADDEEARGEEGGCVAAGVLAGEGEDGGDRVPGGVGAEDAGVWGIEGGDYALALDGVCVSCCSSRRM